MTTSTVSWFDSLCADGANILSSIGQGISDFFSALVDLVCCCSRSALDDVGETAQKVATQAPVKSIKANVMVPGINIKIDYNKYRNEKADKYLEQIAKGCADAHRPFIAETTTVKVRRLITPKEQLINAKNAAIRGMEGTAKLLIEVLNEQKCDQKIVKAYQQEISRLRESTETAYKNEIRKLH